MFAKIEFTLIFVFVIGKFSHSFAFVQNGVIHVEKAVEHYNSIDSTWKAHHHDMHNKNVSISHLKTKLGLHEEQKEYTYDEHHNAEDGKELPEHYDSREAYPQCSSISSIVDQSNCESCWAISVAAVLSDRFCIQSDGKINVTLSSAHLLSCNTVNDGCSGGVMVEAWNYVKNYGLVTGGAYGSFEGCQPYLIQPKGSVDHRCNVPQSTTPKCHHHHCSNRRYKRLETETYKTSKTIRLPDDEEKIMREIYTNGPVTAGMQIFLPFIFYKSGIFQTRGNEELIGLHAVRLIGWGVEDDVKYWIAANSWGRNWGENGFFKIKRGSDHCQIESMVHAGQPIISTKKHLS